MTTIDHTPQPYVTDAEYGDTWTAMLGDSCERLAEVDTDFVDLSVYSPPFASLFTYITTFFSIHYGVASETPHQTAGRSARELGNGVHGFDDRIYDDAILSTNVPIIQSVRRTIFVLLPIVDVGNVCVTIFVSDL